MAAKEEQQAKQPLEETVADWLGRQGYRLEYMTYKALKAQGLKASMAVFHESAEGKRREIDVKAWVDTGDRPLEISIVCECKYSKEPLVLMYSDLRADVLRDLEFIPHSFSVERHRTFFKKNLPHLVALWHFDRKAEFAHTMLQAMKEKNRDVAYDSLQKLAHIAWESTQPSDPDAAHLYATDHIAVVLPAIIVDAPLLRATFNDETGKFFAQPIPFGRVQWFGAQHATLVDVVQVSALKEYAKKVRDTFETLANMLVEVLSERR